MTSTAYTTTRCRMLVVPTIALALLSSSLPAKAQPAAAASQQVSVPAKPTDVASMDAILAALYDVISGPAGQKRDWDRFRSLFVPGARLMPTAQPAGQPGQVTVLTPEAFIQRTSAGFERDGFFEREIGRSVDTFGRVTQVFSAYDSKRKLEDPKPFQRGINSIQLLNDGTRWWVVSIYWDAERPDNPIPARYLKK